jgi:hypothetical protein
MLFYFSVLLKTVQNYLVPFFTGFFPIYLHLLLKLVIPQVPRQCLSHSPQVPSTWQEVKSSINIYWVNKGTQKSMIKLQKQKKKGRVWENGSFLSSWARVAGARWDACRGPGTCGLQTRGAPGRPGPREGWPVTVGKVGWNEARKPRKLFVSPRLG